jgi:hypothetical protein
MPFFISSVFDCEISNSHLHVNTYLYDSFILFKVINFFEEVFSY